MSNYPAPTSVNHKPRVRRGYNPGIYYYYVDSRSQAGVVHMAMTIHGGHCTCKGYQHRGRCAHLDFCRD